MVLDLIYNGMSLLQFEHLLSIGTEVKDMALDLMHQVEHW